MSSPDSSGGDGEVRARVRDQPQQQISAHFDAAASYCDAVYRDGDLQGAIYLRRHAAVLEGVGAAGASTGARALEIGCGAGLLTGELARRGLDVLAVDASPEMLELASARVAAEGFDARVEVADVHALPCAAGAFEIVIAVGVLPWLHAPRCAIAEMARVLALGGQLILTADNRARLVSFLDPRLSLAAMPLKLARDALLRRAGRAASRLHRRRRVDRLLGEAGLARVGRRTVGFGPFTFLGRPLLSGERAVRAHERLQALVDRGVPGARGTGWHYVVRARKG